MIESGRAKYTYSKMHGVVTHGGHELLREQAALLVDEHCFARTDVADELEAVAGERDALRREHPLRTLRRILAAEHQRTNAVRIAEAEDAVTDHHGNDRITAAATAIDRIQRGEDVARRDARRCRPAAAPTRTR